jgi:xylan 1,4-beta-xylosidase
VSTVGERGGGSVRSICNPVLRGSHPDPTVLRMGQDCFVVTSTFQWWPGLRIHRSRDLVSWRLLGHALTRPEQLDLRGMPDSGGVWAPSLSHDGRRFHITYSVVNLRGSFPTTGVANYLISAPEMTGPWSQPRFLNGSGWDPALFHDQDGRSYLLNMCLDQRPGRPATAGILIQELALPEGRLVGPVRRLFAGTALGCTEGPQLLRREGTYYLLTAEGGTSWNHAVTVARSATLDGPFVPDPAGPLLTSAGDPDLPLQKAGHGSLVQMPDGSWYLAHLCARPLGPERRCILGRETGFQQITWTAEGWPRLAGGGAHPRQRVAAPELSPDPVAPEPTLDHFEGPALGPRWSSLRVPPAEDWVDLRSRPSFLRLRGRESVQSLHAQSLVAQRLCSLRSRFETAVEFEPETPQQAAGLICCYDTRDLVYLCVTWDEQVGKCLVVDRVDRGLPRARPAPPVPLPAGRPSYLRAVFDGPVLRLAWSPDRERWAQVGPDLPATQLSDEHGDKDGFTGTFVGLAAQDLTWQSRWAAFDYFSAVAEETPDA